MTLDEMNAKYGKPPVSVNAPTGPSDLETAWGIKPEPSLMDTIKSRTSAAIEDPKGAATGFVKGAGRTALDVAGLMGKGFEAAGVPEGTFITPSDEKMARAEERFAPSSEAETAGGNLETAAEFASVGKDIAIGGAKLLGKGLAKTGEYLAEKGAVKNANKITDLINPTEDMLTSTQKKSAITEGRQLIKGNKLGGTDVSYTPTEETQRAANLLSDIVKPNDKANVVFAKIGSKISTLGAQAEKYLSDAGTVIDAGNHRKAFNTLIDSAKENLAPSALKHYNDEIKLFANQLPNPKNGVISSADYYKALKKWEQNVAENIPKGKDAIIDPTGIGSARIHAAADIRKMARDLIADSSPEFKERMYDLASLFEAKGNALQIAAKQGSKSLIKKYPKTAGVVGAAASAALGGGVVGSILK